MAAYAEVTAITYPARGVNGRTILDTQCLPPEGWRKRLRMPRRRPLTAGIILLAAAFILEIFVTWAGDVLDTRTLGWFSRKLYLAVTALGPFLIPVCWGGIGSSIFLMKRLSDKLFDMAYEESRVKGDVTRIFLGAMLGAIVVVVFFPDFSEQVENGDKTFGPATAAFLAGLGVKPVYAAFERLSETLSNRLAGKTEGS